MTNFIGRMTGAAKLNVAIYEEVEADTSATGQAMAVVCLSALAMGIGFMGSPNRFRLSNGIGSSSANNFPGSTPLFISARALP